jgi:hypothetical protein
MERVFTNVNEPMYKMAKPLPLLPIGRSDFAAFIAARFAATKRPITPEAIRRILDITESHPHDTQELCYFTWSQPEVPGQPITPETVEAALRRVVQAEDARYTAVWETLSANQRAVLMALALGPGQVYSEAYRRTYKLGTAATVQKSLRRLMNDDLVDSSASQGYWVPDVFLRTWLRRLESGL